VMPLAQIRLCQPNCSSAGWDIKPKVWVYSKLDLFIQTECVILYFLYEICNFLINYAGDSIFQSRVGPPIIDSRGGDGGIFGGGALS
jgi:hypothetical protein